MDVMETDWRAWSGLISFRTEVSGGGLANAAMNLLTSYNAGYFLISPKPVSIARETLVSAIM